jgi:hypothetical protein
MGKTKYLHNPRKTKKKAPLGEGGVEPLSFSNTSLLSSLFLFSL